MELGYRIFMSARLVFAPIVQVIYGMVSDVRMCYCRWTVLARIIAPVMSICHTSEHAAP